MQRYREKQTKQNFTAIFCCFALKVCVKGKLLPFQGVWFEPVVTQGDALGWELLPLLCV